MRIVGKGVFERVMTDDVGYPETATTACQFSRPEVIARLATSLLRKTTGPWNVDTVVTHVTGRAAA